MKLSDFVEDSLTRTGDQIRECTHKDYKSKMDDFIRVIGNIDYRRVCLKGAEFYRQSCLDKGNSSATVVKKLTGHADFKTTHKYYLRVHDDLVDRARQVTARGFCKNLL